MGRWARAPGPCPPPPLPLLLLLLLLLGRPGAQLQANRVSTGPSSCGLGLPWGVQG